MANDCGSTGLPLCPTHRPRVIEYNPGVVRFSSAKNFINEVRWSGWMFIKNRFGVSLGSEFIQPSINCVRMTVTINNAVMPRPKASICITPIPRRPPTADMTYRVVGRETRICVTSQRIIHPPNVSPATKQTVNPMTHKVSTVSSACQKISPPLVNTASPIVNHIEGGGTPSSPRRIPNTETVGSLSSGASPKPSAVISPINIPVNNGQREGGASDKPSFSSARTDRNDCPA